MKIPNVRHCQACSQKKGLSRASRLQTSLSSARDRHATAARAGRGTITAPREASYTKLQAGSIANQDFLGFWTVNICREGRSQRSAPQKRHTACLRRCTRCTPRKLSGWDGGGDKSQPSPGGDCAYQAPGHLSCSDLGRAQNTGPTESRPLRSTRVSEPEQLRPEKCIQPRASLRQFPTEQPRAQAVLKGKAHSP